MPKNPPSTCNFSFSLPLSVSLFVRPLIYFFVHFTYVTYYLSLSRPHSILLSSLLSLTHTYIPYVSYIHTVWDTHTTQPFSFTPTHTSIHSLYLLHSYAMRHSTLLPYTLLHPYTISTLTLSYIHVPSLPLNCHIYTLYFIHVPSLPLTPTSIIHSLTSIYPLYPYTLTSIHSLTSMYPSLRLHTHIYTLSHIHVPSLPSHYLTSMYPSLLLHSHIYTVFYSHSFSCTHVFLISLLQSSSSSSCSTFSAFFHCGNYVVKVLSGSRCFFKNMYQPRNLFVYFWSCLQQFYRNIVDFSRIQTRIFVV